MKRFIDDKGTFEIKVPTTWKYSLKQEKVHTFQEYEIWKPDAFQISITVPNNNDAILRFQGLKRIFPNTQINGQDFFSYPDIHGKGFVTKFWTSLIEGKIVLFTLTHTINQDFDLDKKTINEKIEIVYKVISEFRLIEADKSEQHINSYRFDMFIRGFGATVYMVDKAVENQSFIEATCLLASQIDGLLRIGIVLQKQIDNNNSVIEKEWIYQGLADKKKSEKDIYKKAKELGILNDEILNELNVLYEDRNRVIHRFIISEITVAEVENISYKYYQMQKKINSIIYDIESKQIELGVGMTTVDNVPDENHYDYIKGKIGKQNYFEDKTTSE